MCYVWSEPSDGSSQVGRLLVGVERSGRRGEVGIVEEQSPVTADPFQLVVVGRKVPGASNARTTRSAAGQTSSSLVLGCLFIRPVPFIFVRKKKRKRESHSTIISASFFVVVAVVVTIKACCCYFFQKGGGREREMNDHQSQSNQQFSLTFGVLTTGLRWKPWTNGW